MSILLNRLQYMLSPQFDLYEQIAEHVSGSVADVGCGLGFGCHLLRKHAETVAGYDIDAECVSFAQRNFGFNGLSFAVGDISLGPIQEASFDYVVMADVVEHIQQDQQAVGHVSKMLKPGGTFICTTPNRLSRYRKSANHVREYSLREFQRLLDRSFSSVDICTYAFAPVRHKFENPLLAVCRKEA